MKKLKILSTFLALAVGISARAISTVDVNFSHRLEIIKAGEQYQFLECLKDKCKPLQPRAVISFEEAKVAYSKAFNQYGGATSQIFYDLSQKYKPNQKTKMVLGSVLSPLDFKTVIYYIESSEDIKSKTSDSYILKQACNESQCRPFTLTMQTFEQTVQEINLLLQ